MRFLSRRTAEVAGFLLSLLVLGVVYGYLAHRYALFPHGLLDPAVRQAEREVEARTEPPDFTSGRVYRGGGVNVLEPEAMQPGLTLITSVWQGREEDAGWIPGLALIDREGRMVHGWGVRPEELFADSVYRRGEDISEQSIHGSHLFENGDVLVNIEYAGTVRLDACGRAMWKMRAGNHHSIARDDDGTFWIPGITELRPPRSSDYPDGFPGFRDSLHQDLIVHVDPDPKAPRVLKAINVIDVLYDNDLAYYLAKYQKLDARDPVHLNAVEPLPDSLADEYPLFDGGDLLVSLRNMHLVFVLDPATGRVVWSVSRPLVWQHDPHFLGDGWVGVFNNNWDFTQHPGQMLGGSEILALEPGSDSTRVLFPTEKSDPFYTGIKGKWQPLANGNLLLTEATAGRVVEVAPDGRTLWEWAAEPYSESRVPQVSKATRVDLTPEEVSEWPCSEARPGGDAGQGSG